MDGWLVGCNPLHGCTVACSPSNFELFFFTMKGVPFVTQIRRPSLLKIVDANNLSPCSWSRNGAQMPPNANSTPTYTTRPPSPKFRWIMCPAVRSPQSGGCRRLSLNIITNLASSRVLVTAH